MVLKQRLAPTSRRALSVIQANSTVLFTIDLVMCTLFTLEISSVRERHPLAGIRKTSFSAIGKVFVHDVTTDS